MPASPALRGRYATGAMFFVNGFLTGSWAPQIPVLLTRLDITEFTLGLLILVFGLGALTSMPWCGLMLHRHGSRAVLRGFAALCVFALLGVAASANVFLAAAAMFVFGGLIGGMDVAMNASAVTVEDRMGRAVMSSSHGFWSLGGFAGSAAGGYAIAQWGFFNHALLATALSAVLVAAAWPFLLADRRHEQAASEPYRLPRHMAVYLTGLIALFSMIPEGAVLDWAALYLRQELGAGIETAGFAFAAFSATMAAMRFLGDGVRNRFGAVTTLRVSALVAAAGMAAAGLAPNAWIAIPAFALSGLGVANMMPIAFSAAGNQPGTVAGAGLSTVTLMGYSGILVAPSAIGFIGEQTGFAPVFVTLALLLVTVALMAGIVRQADFRSARQPAA